MIERYSRSFAGAEHVFNYTERPNIGILSAAAWRAGFMSLEEFRFEKLRAGGESSGGRCDLWVSHDHFNREWYIEAKFDEISLNSTDPIGQIKKIMNEALEDTVSSSSFENAKGVGVSFIRVYDLAKRMIGDDRQIESILELVNLISSNKSYLKCDAVAWCFPSEARLPIHEDHKYGSMGVFMFCQQHKFST